MRKIIETVSEEVQNVLNNVSEDDAVDLSELLIQAKRIFVFGEGRSGLMAKAFAMRLMHGGYTVFVVGETVTPSIQESDLLVIISGSGSSAMILSLVDTAKKVNAALALVTTDRKSYAAKQSECVLIVPAATKHRQTTKANSIQPLGNQFDQSVHLLLDSIIIYTLEQATNSVSYEEMKKQHTNLE